MSLEAVRKRSKKQISKEFNFLDHIFDWGGKNMKPMINSCKEMNVYCDVAPFKETAVILGQGTQSEKLSNISK